MRSKKVEDKIKFEKENIAVSTYHDSEEIKTGSKNTEIALIWDILMIFYI